VQRPESTPAGLRGRAGSGRRRAAVFGGILVLAFSVTAAPLSMARQPGQPRLTVAGVAEDPCQPQRALPVPAGQSGQFEPDSSILRTAAGAYAAPGLSSPPARDQSACATAAEQADREWLRAGAVPGDTPAWRSMATRALLDLRLDVRPNGAVVAGWRSDWDYDWPRDSSWVAVALAQTGHPAMAYRILGFLQRMQPRNGIWAARYLPGGSGPVLDGRPAELDADGWVPWAVWSWAATQPLTPEGRPSRELAQLWPMVVRAADAAARSLTRDGLPGPAMDYWENSVQVTLGTAAPLLAGLRAAAALAAGIGGAAATRDGHRWAAAAARLARAITAAFGRTGYQRQPLAGSGADAAVTFLGPPFAAPGPQVLRAARSAQQALSVPGGGLAPGQAWTGTPGVAWTAETAFFALFDASTGQHDQAAALLDWLAAHRTNLGSLPEQVNSAGQPASTAPLAWTDAVTLLALLAQTRHVPAVPLPPRGTLERGGVGHGAGSSPRSGCKRPAVSGRASSRVNRVAPRIHLPPICIFSPSRSRRGRHECGTLHILLCTLPHSCTIRGQGTSRGQRSSGSQDSAAGHGAGAAERRARGSGVHPDHRDRGAPAAGGTGRGRGHRRGAGTVRAVAGIARVPGRAPGPDPAARRAARGGGGRGGGDPHRGW
jgi:glucoamylase